MKVRGMVINDRAITDDICLSQSDTKMSLRRTPWANWSEWETVRQGLFSEDGEQCSLALAHIAAWRARGRVPVSVDSTANLLQTLVIDSQRSDEMSTRLQLGLAIVRWVNGLCEAEQKVRLDAVVYVVE
jgi:ribosomal biogenesis protein LAS1